MALLVLQEHPVFAGGALAVRSFTLLAVGMAWLAGPRDGIQVGARVAGEALGWVAIGAGQAGVKAVGLTGVGLGHRHLERLHTACTLVPTTFTGAAGEPTGLAPRLHQVETGVTAGADLGLALA